MTTLMDEAVDVGTTLRLAYTFSLDTVNPVDPSTVNFYTKNPSGAEVTSPIVVKDAPGQYHADLFVPISGQWRYRWVSSDPALVKEGSFVVRPSRYSSSDTPLGSAETVWGEFDGQMWGEF